MRRFLTLLLALAALAMTARAGAMDPALVHDLAFGDGDVKDKAIVALTLGGDARALALLVAWSDGAARTRAERVLLVDGDKAVDAVTGEPVSPVPTDPTR